MRGCLLRRLLLGRILVQALGRLSIGLSLRLLLWCRSWLRSVIHEPGGMIVDRSRLRHMQDRGLGDGSDSRLRSRLRRRRARGVFKVLVRDRLRTSVCFRLAARLCRNRHRRVLLLLCLLMLLIRLSILLILRLLRHWGGDREGVRHGAHIEG